MITGILCNHYLKCQQAKFAIIFFFFFRLSFAKNNNHKILSVTLTCEQFKLECNFT